MGLKVTRGCDAEFVKASSDVSQIRKEVVGLVSTLSNGKRANLGPLGYIDLELIMP